MNILVTGGRGQLGQSIRKVSGEYPDCSFLFTDLPEADITDAEVIGRLIEENGIDTIINCAAFTSAERAERDCGDEALWVNVHGPMVLASVAKAHGVSMVHVSTDYVFDGESRVPYTEEAAAGPLNVYGITKLGGENGALASGADLVIVRTSWLYSEFGSNFMKTMLSLAEKNGEVWVVNDQTGSPTYATDLARAIMVLVGRGIKGQEIYHFSDAGEVTWYNFTKEIFRQAGVGAKVNPITSIEYPSPVKRPAYSVLDTSKIGKAGAVVPQWADSLGVCLAALRASEGK